MRLGRALFLISVFLFGQVHACPPNWVSRDGADCTKCALQTAQAAELGSKDSEAKLTADSKDCRPCCTVKGCAQHGGSKPAPAPHQPVCIAILPCAHPTVVIPAAPVSASNYSELVACLSNGPPGKKSSRAPPTN
ncbi:MAG: hypothetical protein JSS66_10840 [Armatimonadetes bacterium]|nr:hypothetical protein [Armatimonadota bacterium]